MKSTNGHVETTELKSDKPEGNAIPEIIVNTVVTDKRKVASHLDIIVSLPKSAPSWLECFLGTCFDIRSEMISALQIIQDEIERKEQVLRHEGENDTPYTDISNLKLAQHNIKEALAIYRLTPAKVWLYQWSAVALLVLSTSILLIIVELYVRWHGGTVFGNLLDLYNQQQVDMLSQITFVNGGSTISIIFEILVWSSVGVWAQQAYANTIKMINRTFRFGDHAPMYFGIMMRNTGVAASVILLMRLTQFSIFGVSLDNTNAFAFDATIGLSFLLGFFGDDTIRILTGFRNVIISGTERQISDRG